MSPAQPKINELDASIRKILRERAREVSKRQDSEHRAEGQEILEVHSRSQNFALPLASIASISELTSLAPIPRVPSAIRGLVSIRGEILIGVELALLASGAASGIADLRRVIVLQSENQRIAVLAERIVAVKNIQLPSFRNERPADMPFLTGTDENFLSLVDPGALIRFTFNMVSGGSR
jgi:chemotaxis signal transduction protein